MFRGERLSPLTNEMKLEALNEKADAISARLQPVNLTVSSVDAEKLRRNLAQQSCPHARMKWVPDPRVDGQRGRYDCWDCGKQGDVLEQEQRGAIEAEIRREGREVIPTP